MPKKPLVEKDQLLRALDGKREDIIKNGKVVGPSSKVWYDFQLVNNFPMTPKAIYTFALKHLSVKTTVSEPLIHSEVSLANDLSEDPANTSSDSGESVLANTKNFTIKMGKEKWELMKPVDSTYKRRDENNRISAMRQYRTLRPGVWTNLINEAIWSEKKIACTLVFKRAKVGTDLADKFLTIKAVCKDCHSSFYGYCDKEPGNSEELTLTFSVEGNTDVPHTSGMKRQLSGKRRADIVQNLIDKKESASKYRKLEARKEMELFDREPAHLPSLEVLRKAKSDAVAKQRIHENLYTSLQLIQYSEPFKNSIKDVGLDRFWVHYWSTDQLRLYNLYCSKTRVPTIFIDATGGVVKKIQRPGGNMSGHIFLYCGVIKVNSREENQIPVVCMLSERHDTNAISFWLKEWLKSGAQLPIQCITDFSLALLSACCSAFTKYNSIHDYINKCYDILVGNVEEEDIPYCFIRVDIAHVMKLVSQWPSLSGKSQRIREFYIRSVGQLVLSTTLDRARNIISAMLSVSLSETEGMSSATGEQTVSESCKHWLKKIISSPAADIDYEPYILISEHTLDEMENAKNCPRERERENKFTNWSTEILEECKLAVKNDSGDRDNLHYVPDLSSSLLPMCGKLPLWTGIMRPIFGYGRIVGSSSSVESYFKELKVNLMGNEKNHRVDNFLMQHIKLNDGSLKIASSTSTFQEETREARQDENRSLIVERKNIQSENQTPTAAVNGTTCIACSMGNSPEGAHKCLVCQKAVHALEGCSLPVGEEGFGQKRTCMSCVTKKQTPPFPDRNLDVRERHERVKPILDELKEVENWRCQATQNKCKTSFYLSPCPEIIHVEESGLKKRLKIFLIKNGNCLKLKPRREGKEGIVLENTCAFDSVVQGLAVCLCDSNNYSKMVGLNVQGGIFQLALGLVQQSRPHTLYQQRITLLKPHYPNEIMKQNAIRVKCATTAMDVVSKLLPASLSEIKECSSPFCPEKTTTNNFALLRVDSQVLAEHGIASLEEAIKRGSFLDNKNNTLKCFKALRDSATPEEYKHFDPDISSSELCYGNVTYQQTFGPNGHFIVEVASHDLDRQEQASANHDFEANSKFNLAQIPSHVSLSGNNFHLRAVVAFSPPLIPKGIGHYVAYCKRSDGGWELYDDLRNKVCRTNDKKTVCIHLIIYTV